MIQRQKGRDHSNFSRTAFIYLFIYLFHTRF